MVIPSEGRAQDFIQILICSGKKFVTQIFKARKAKSCTRVSQKVLGRRLIHTKIWLLPALVIAETHRDVHGTFEVAFGT